VLLNELGSQGRSNAVPFRMAMKRQQHADEILHVSCLEKRSLSQVRASVSVQICIPLLPQENQHRIWNMIGWRSCCNVAHHTQCH
jgi:hypothetical protein